MHCGRVGHADNKAPTARFLAPSAVACLDQIFTEQGMQPMGQPEAMTRADIAQTIADYRQAAINARAAGFDAIELHFTSGYLPAQFLSTGTNQREDEFGGFLENRLRFPLALVEACCNAIGADRVGVRVCPGNPFNGLSDNDPTETFKALFQRLNHFDLAWLHVIRMDAVGIDNIALANKYYQGNIIVNDSYSQDEAAQVIEEGHASAVSFGRKYIANPDLVERFKHNQPLNKIDFSTLYTPGEKGFIDYPCLSDSSTISN
jgi:N-ethylmaleimide reductase